jgi:hypothetical protein
MGRSGQSAGGRQQPARAASVPGSIAWHVADEDEVRMARDALLEVENDLGTTLIYIERLDGSGDDVTATIRSVSFEENAMHWDEPHEWDSEMFALLIAKTRAGKVRRAAYSTGWPWNWHQHVRS